MLKCHDMQWRIPPSHGVGTTSHQMARQLTDPPSVRRRCSRGEFFVLVRWSHQFTESISSAIETYLIFTFVSPPPLTSVGRSTSTNPVHMPGFVDIHNRAKWMWIVDVIGTWTDSTEFSVYPNMEVEILSDSVLSEQRAFAVRWPSLPSLILPSSNSNSFISIADCFIASHLSIDYNKADDEEPRINISTSTPIRIPISELFNFDNEYWSDVLRASSMRGLTQEMELHELLDLDGEGEVDAEENAGDIILLLGLTSILNSMIHLCVGMRTPCRNLVIIHVWCKYPYCLLYTGKSISTVGHGQSMFLWICGSSNTAANTWSSASVRVDSKTRYVQRRQDLIGTQPDGDLPLPHFWVVVKEIRLWLLSIYSSSSVASQSPLG